MEELRSAASFEGLIVIAVIYFLLAAISKAGRRRAGQVPPPPPGPEDATPTQQEGFSLEAVLREIERVKREAEGRSAPEHPAEARPRLSNPAPKPKPAGQRPRALPSTERPGRMTAPQAEQRPRALPSSERSGRMATPQADKRPRALPLTERTGRMARAQTDAGPLGRHGRTGLPGAEEVEERTSLEEGGSIEVEERFEVLDDTRLRTRVEVDQDEGAEAVVQRRIQEAAARNRELSDADHRKFHDRIKQTEAEPRPAAQKRSIAQLRQAFIWREILGPPKALE